MIPRKARGSRLHLMLGSSSSGFDFLSRPCRARGRANFEGHFRRVDVRVELGPNDFDINMVTAISDWRFSFMPFRPVRCTLRHDTQRSCLTNSSLYPATRGSHLRITTWPYWPLPGLFWQICSPLACTNGFR